MDNLKEVLGSHFDPQLVNTERLLGLLLDIIEDQYGDLTYGDPVQHISQALYKLFLPLG